MKVIKLDGFCHQTADESEISVKSEYRNTLLRALNDSRFSVYAHIIRRRIEPETGGHFANEFCRRLDERYMQGVREQRMYTNDLYLTVLRGGFQGKVGMADNLFARFRRAGGTSASELEKQARRELNDQVRNIAKDMSSYGARVLGLRYGQPGGVAGPGQGVVQSEILEFLAQLLNGGVEVPMALPRMPLDGYLPTRRITFNSKAVELVGPASGEKRFGGLISVREYAPFSFAGMFDGLLRIPGEFIVTQSFRLQDRAPMMAAIDRVKRQIGNSDERGTEIEDTINTAKDEIASGRAVMGVNHISVMALGNTIREMETCVAAVNKELLNTGVVAIREDLNCEMAFWSQLPGNFDYIARKSFISSRNFSGFASFHNYALGKAWHNHWGPAISLLQTTSLTPYYFNFHRRQVGNFTICGPTGSGKTVALSFLMSQAMRIEPAPRLAFFDKDRGADVFIRAMGGQYEMLQPGVPTGFNPLQLDGTEGDKAFLKDLFKLMLRPRDGSTDFSPQQEKIIDNAIAEIFRLPKEERVFSEVKQLLRGEERATGHGLAARFEIWTEARGWLFNNSVDTWSAGNGIFGFDLTKVLDDPDVRSAALGYIFHRIEQMLDGKPMMVVIDEGWKILTDDKFSAFIHDKLKTIRKLNGIVGFGTQSAKDIAKAEMAHTLLEQTPTNIFFPDVKGDESSYIDGFKLSRKELQWVRETAPEARQFLIKHDHDSVVAKLDLSGMPDFLKVLSGTKETVEECENLRMRYGNEPSAWLPHFCGWSS